MDILEKRKARFEFLNKLYEITNGDSSYMVNMWELGEELGFERSVISNIVDYLTSEYLIEPRALGGGIAITHSGIIEIEELHNNPNESTEHFPSINIIHIENMNNSAIQQGTINSNQNAIFKFEKINDLQIIIDKIENAKNELALSKDSYNELESEIQTLKSQIISPKPKNVIITESLKTIRNIIEGVIGNAIAPNIINLISGLI